MEETLRECPFCGGEATLDQNADKTWVRCRSCRAESNYYKVDLNYCAKDQAIEAWNRRPEQNNYDDTANISIEVAVTEICRIVRKLEGKFLK